MADPTPERIDAALALAEAVDTHAREVHWYTDSDGSSSYNAVGRALAAYRAAAPKPRTRAAVDAEIAAECREYHDRIRRADGTPPRWDGMTTGWVDRLNSLCTEPTEEGHHG